MSQNSTSGAPRVRWSSTVQKDTGSRGWSGQRRVVRDDFETEEVWHAQFRERMLSAQELTHSQVASCLFRWDLISRFLAWTLQALIIIAMLDR